MGASFKFLVIGLILLCGVLGLTQAESQSEEVHKTNIQVYFSPDGGCTDAIVKTIEGAKKSVKVQAYSFTSAPIAKALVEASKRGVSVEAVLDKSNKTDRYSSATFLKNNDIPVWIDGKHKIAHNKIILVDDEIVITGSFNFSKAAEESNAENLLIIKEKSVVKRYVINYNEHREHSVVYERPPGPR